ncbi:hypothetical protein Bpfe_030802 [Biomphalaria pfeifferi]|uniref:Uncharacterized protein n=1 Tax=Biomphalaria pfeifferi TaxID=112525 RepID=A0AAD8AMT9_BIOPF|nr:hypothetical protein Bpfe_031377 [Biomphalaria pfeifferi]KAK0039226.1 hypothetical protein Bpfe_031347 [Biomphalaria pfeifferi]KAK0039285.1 hypothetical protein Bpfe_031288 [Biomphalaria pfeifferi]KAK0039350.1 hypothetical protein Bpfe_031217 [Biomphalaria pfeifferi]KAK0039616.1 hypothetical protein Bpfe_030955 [Biomphalaria pfeifferi]
MLARRARSNTEERSAGTVAQSPPVELLREAEQPRSERPFLGPPAAHHRRPRHDPKAVPREAAGLIAAEKPIVALCPWKVHAARLSATPQVGPRDPDPQQPQAERRAEFHGLTFAEPPVYL